MTQTCSIDVSAAGRTRAALALAIVAAAYFAQNAALDPLYHLIQTALGLPPRPTPNTLMCAGYALLVTLRLAWWLVVAVGVGWIDRRGIADVLRIDGLQRRHFLKGLAIGLFVMAATVLMIVAVGDAQLSLSPGSAAIHVAYGASWLASEVIGAAGEELLFRALILIIAARLFGMRAAAVLSALAFSLSHGANPGASLVWMARLAAAGLLLAWSVYRSGAIWWAVGYHAGWNFASAPLFGAAGSGYIDQGHIFTFTPSGSSLITGGPVGPEGSAFAFVAVVVATALLLATVPRTDRMWRGAAA